MTSILLNPLDILRTRLQSAHALRLRPDKLMAHIVRTEGVLGLYRGLVPSMVGVAPSRAFTFGTLNFAKRKFGPEGLGWSGAPLDLASSAVAGVVANTVMSPWWVVRTRLQLQNTPIEPIWISLRRTKDLLLRKRPPDPPGATRGYAGLIDAFVKIYREEGISAFYRGLTASYLGVSETVVHFAIYGRMKAALTEYQVAAATQNASLMPFRGGDSRVAPPPSTSSSSSSSSVFSPRPSGLALFGVAAVSKLVASALTYPHEVLRTRMREQRTGAVRYVTLLQGFRLIVAEEGVRGLYGGMGVHLVRTVPNAAILMLIVEQLVGGEV